MTTTTTWLGERDQVVARLMKENHLPRRVAEQETDELLAMDATLRPAFLKWWNEGIIDDSIVVKGYTVRRIMELRALTSATPAFGWLDYLVRKPQLFFQMIDAPPAPDIIIPRLPEE